MICFACKTGRTEPGHTTVSLDRGEAVIVVKNLPADICAQCGAPYFAPDVSQRVSDTADEAVDRGAELAVVKFAAGRDTNSGSNGAIGA